MVKYHIPHASLLCPFWAFATIALNSIQFNTFYYSIRMRSFIDKDNAN